MPDCGSLKYPNPRLDGLEVKDRSDILVIAEERSGGDVEDRNPVCRRHVHVMWDRRLEKSQYSIRNPQKSKKPV